MNMSLMKPLTGNTENWWIPTGTLWVCYQQSTAFEKLYRLNARGFLIGQIKWKKKFMGAYKMKLAGHIELKTNKQTGKRLMFKDA